MPTLRRYVRRRQIPYAQPAGPGTLVLIPEDALERLARRDAGETVPAEDENTDPESATLKPRPGPRPRWQQR
ncbi:MAG: hypothetical protein ACOC9P_02420 [bacterium]